MTQIILGHPLLVFYPTDSTAPHIRGQRENLVCRNHAGSGKARSAQGASQFAAGYAADRL